MHRPRLLVTTFALAMFLAACGSDSPTVTDIATTTFASSLNVNLAAMTRTTNGLYYQDSTVGTGATAQPGQSLTVKYVGWLANGTQFDASASHSPGTFSFTLGAGQVIQGWDIGLTGMKVGGWRKLVIPPSLGYGDQANGSIPGNSILVFNVQLVATQ